MTSAQPVLLACVENPAAEPTLGTGLFTQGLQGTGLVLSRSDLEDVGLNYGPYL